MTVTVKACVREGKLLLSVRDDARGGGPAPTSNRTFGARQGKGGRTHLVSPAVAAASAIAGHLAAPADL